jgi:hypothetical protein
VSGTDLGIDQECLLNGFEQRARALLARGRRVEELEQRLPRVRCVEQLAAERDRLVHRVDDDRRDQVLLGGEVAKQRPATHAGALCDLRDAHIEAALAEQLGGCVEQPPAVAFGIGPGAP